MQVREVMNKKAPSIKEDADIKSASRAFSLSRSPELFVVDGKQNLIGTLSEGDLIRAMMPGPDVLKETDGSILSAIKVFIDNGENLVDKPISPLVIRKPIMLHPEDQLLYAAQIMIEKQIRQLPVVEFSKLVGALSRSDICWALVWR